MKVKFKNIEFYILVISIILQNFAIIRTNSFGISPVAIFGVYAFFRYCINKKYFKSYAYIFGSVIVIAMIGFIFNNQYDFKKLIRLEMIVFIAVVTYIYVKSIIEDNRWNDFKMALYNSTFVLCLYGIYQYVAGLLKLPLFLNIFENNPSYGVKGIDSYYGGGWTSIFRVYATFSEPSFYSIFLVLFILLVLLDSKTSVKKKLIYICIASVNLFLTFARSGWGMIGYIIIFFIIVNMLIKYVNPKLKNIFLYIFLIIIPFVNLLIMKVLDQFIFKDLSSKARTMSAIYYLQQSFMSIKNLIIGHGLGSIQRNYSIVMKKQVIEQFAHNGYVEIIYELGIIFFIALIIFIVHYIKRIKDSKLMILTLIVTSSFFVFESYYNVESLICMLIIFVSSVTYLPDEDIRLDFIAIKKRTD